MQEKEKNELFEKFNALRNEVSELKNSLNQADEQKEKWFKSKEELSGRIRSLIGGIKESRTKRNSLTGDVKKLKEKRKELNDKIKGRISEIKSIHRQEKEIIGKYRIQGDPSAIKREIDRLDSRIETDVMSFEKEKDLMKKIKGLKKRLEQTKGLTVVLKKKDEISKEIDVMKSEAKDVHKKVQDTAKESQVRHESAIKNSGEIDSFKKSEEDAFKKFIESKMRFNEINSKLKEKLLEMSRIREKLDAYRKEDKKREKEREERVLKSREEFVREKMKKGEKLTTEDLLVFQNLKE